MPAFLFGPSALARRARRADEGMTRPRTPRIRPRAGCGCSSRGSSRGVPRKKPGQPDAYRATTTFFSRLLICHRRLSQRFVTIRCDKRAGERPVFAGFQQGDGRRVLFSSPVFGGGAASYAAEGVTPLYAMPPSGPYDGPPPPKTGEEGSKQGHNKRYVVVCPSSGWKARRYRLPGVRGAENAVAGMYLNRRACRSP